MFDGDSLLSFKRDAEMTATIDRKATVSGGLFFGALSDAECVLKLNMLNNCSSSSGRSRAR